MGVNMGDNDPSELLESVKEGASVWVSANEGDGDWVGLGKIVAENKLERD